jgi:hypothetical protein
MAKTYNKNKERKFGTQKPEKKPLIDPKYKNTIWTIVFLAILVIFFIVNNTRSVPEEGPYPPNYHPDSLHTIQ